MPLKPLGIPDPPPSETRPQHLPRMLPGFSISRENAFPQELPQIPFALVREAPRFEIGGEEALEVLGFDGGDEGCAEDADPAGAGVEAGEARRQ